jgi:hypothetical protein
MAVASLFRASFLTAAKNQADAERGTANTLGSATCSRRLTLA